MPPQVHVVMGASGYNYPDFPHLAWASNWIVRGKVAQQLPSQRFPAENGPLGTETPQEYYDTQTCTDYTFKVEQVFRGKDTESVTVRRIGGTVDPVTVTSDDQPELRVDDELVLFLIPPDDSQPGNALWVTGDQQGYWRVENNRVVPARSDYPSFSLTQFGQTITDVLKQDPPSDLGNRLVPLSEAPAGSGLPAVSVTPAS